MISFSPLGRGKIQSRLAIESGVGCEELQAN
jgi:hypothetical protein